MIQRPDIRAAIEAGHLAPMKLAMPASNFCRSRISLMIDVSRAEAIPGVRLVLTHADSPPLRFSTARHHSRTDDPDDTSMLSRERAWLPLRAYSRLQCVCHLAAPPPSDVSEPPLGW